MKKNFLAMTALAAMLFAGCTSSDDITTRETITKANEAATPINFGTYMGKTGTRAGTPGTITTDGANSTVSLQTQGFGVFAYMKGTNGATDCFTYSDPNWNWNVQTPNFMYNQQVTYSASKWSYSPVKYWPNDFSTGSVDARTPAATGSVNAGKISFFAYAPYVAATATTGTVSPNTEGITALSANNADTEPWVTYKFKKTGTPEKYDLTTSQNVDLLWGTRTTASYDLASGSETALDGKYKDSEGNSYNTDLTKQKTAETIDFNFKHALAKFGGKEGTRCGLQVVADFDLNDESPSATPSGTASNVKAAETLITLNSIKIENMTEDGKKFAIGGKFNLARGTWSDWVYAGAGDLRKEYTVGSTTNAEVWEPSTLQLTYDSGWKNSTESLPGVDETFKDVFSDVEDALYFIPGGNCTMKITVQYTVRTYDANLVDIDGANPAETTSTKVVQTIANVVNFGTLKSNHFYKLIIHLGMTSVKFAATVADWDTTTGSTDDTQVIWLPSNVIGS